MTPRLTDRRSRSAEIRPGERRWEERQRLLVPRLFVLFLFGCVLFGYPILGLFERPGEIAGIPALFLYLFGAWALFIGLLAWLAESGGWARGRPRRRPPP